MSLGLGNGLFTQQKNISASSIVTGGQNGVSKVSDRLELGLNPLLHHTLLDLDVFNFTIKDSVNFAYIRCEPTNTQNVSIGDLGSQMIVDIANGITSIGDVNGAVNNTRIEVNDALLGVDISADGFKRLVIDAGAGQYRFGDIDAYHNGTFFEISSTARTFDFWANSSLRMLSLNYNGGQPISTMGDVDGGNNNTKIIIDDSAQSFTAGSNNTTGLFLSLLTRVYKIGDTLSTVNGTKITIDDSATIVTVESATGLFIDAATQGLVIKGDTVMIHSQTPYADGASLNTATLTNAPSSGNPTKWVPIDDNGVTRYIPTWQ